MILTSEMVDSGKSRAGGWSEEQFRLLGISWPPQPGWKERVIGRHFDRKALARFLWLKDRHIAHAGQGELFE